MFKNALRFVTTLGLLLAGYAAYARAFALVESYLRSARVVPALARGTTESKTKRQAINEAIQAFGEGHWTTDPDLQIRYYNAERGFWMYAREYRRLDDGKQLEFRPFAIIWRSKDGKSVKTALSDTARVDLDRPLGLMSKPGQDKGVLRVVHARVEGNVRIRDDKGTPLDESDDLRINPGPYVEYDESTLQITGGGNELVEILDRDLKITGVGLLIQLRPRGEGPAPEGMSQSRASVGFDGAQTASLRKNVDITIGDVGAGGVLPGKPRGPRPENEKTPLHVHCDAAMRIDMPKPHLPVRVGPPAPPSPTFIQFDRNVEVVRGKPGEPPDRLNCDHLDLTLVPAEKTPDAATDKTRTDGKAASPRQGPLNELTLRYAHASGHAVHVISAAQGVKARCNELIHVKGGAGGVDETYFRGDATTKLVVEKIDVATNGPERGKVTAFTTIRTIDAKIFESGQGADHATIVARGPGEMEWRPGLDRAIERTAKWEDTLTIENDPIALAAQAAGPLAKGNEPSPVAKRISLTGRPRFSDVPSGAQLEAERTVVIWLEPKSNAPAPTPAAREGEPAKPRSSFELEKLVALKNVRLTAPGKSLTARERLDAEFHPKSGPGRLPTVVATSTPASSASEAAANAAPAAKSAARPDAAKPATAPAKPERPVEPAASASADIIWASVILREGTEGGAGALLASNATASSGAMGSGKAELDKVFLRGGVRVHQDPALGKVRGTDVTGAAVDLFAQEGGGTRFVVFNKAPAPSGAANPKRAAAPEPPAPPAVIETDEMTVRGDVIGLDQSVDEAWVRGRGSFTQLTAKGLLSDRTPTLKLSAPVGAPVPKLDPNAPPEKKVPITIAWSREMRFHGQSTDLRGRPAARAEFHGDVRASMEDALLACSDVMRAYLDRTVKLVRPRSEPAAEGNATARDESRPDIALLEMVKDVVLVNQKRDPADANVVVQKQRIEGDYLVYERATGKFRVPGVGQVLLYEREGQAASLLGPKVGALESLPDVRVIRASATAPVSPADRDLDVAPAQAGARPAGTPPLPNPSPVVGHVPGPLDRARAQGRARDGNAPQGRNQAGSAGTPRPITPPLNLTHVKFRKDMIGRFGSGKEADKNETRWADFFGDVEVLRGRVRDVDTLLDADRLPIGSQFMTAQVLRVVSEPNRSAGPDAPPRYLLRAWENAYATIDDKTIQADTITFDSDKQLVYAYGEDGRDVVIAQQGQIGQGASTVQGRAAVYNHKTGEAQLIEPKQMAFVDLRTGTRPRPLTPPSDSVPLQKPKRAQLRNPMGNIERKDFTGR